MGTCIFLSISKSITQAEWEPVYEETLRLAKKLRLAEKQPVEFYGVQAYCLVPTEERDYIGSDRKHHVEWNTVGEYFSLQTAEDYYLPRYLVEDKNVEKDAPDAITGALPVRMYDAGFLHDDDRFCHTYRLWGNKTQNESYHIALLAIAALIEARLGTKAFVYGDVTRRQVEYAVRVANQYTDAPVDLPVCCDHDRLIERVKTLPLTTDEKAEVIWRFYLIDNVEALRGYMQQISEENAVRTYWEQRFKGLRIGTPQFERAVADFIRMDLPPEILYQYVDGDINKDYTAEDLVQLSESVEFYWKNQRRMETPFGWNDGDYDITDFRSLEYYEEGATISPDVKAVVRDVREEMIRILESTEFAQLVNYPPSKDSGLVTAQS